MKFWNDDAQGCSLIAEKFWSDVPGVFVFVGARNPDIGAEHPQHSCYYTVDETTLVKGSMVAVQWACDMLA